MGTFRWSSLIKKTGLPPSKVSVDIMLAFLGLLSTGGGVTTVEAVAATRVEAVSETKIPLEVPELLVEEDITAMYWPIKLLPSDPQLKAPSQLWPWRYYQHPRQSRLTALVVITIANDWR